MWGFRSPNGTPASHQSQVVPSRQSGKIKVRDLDAERPGAPTPSSSSSSARLSMGGLLRLFRSEFFDAFMAVTYLYRYRESRGIHDYLCNELYKLSDADLENFMPQLCNLLVHHAKDSPGLERFVMDKCADSMHIALQVFWFLQAAVEDAARQPDSERESRCRLLRTRCETAAINGSKHVMMEAAITRLSDALVANESPFSAKKQVSANSLFLSASTGQLSKSSSPTILSTEQCTTSEWESPSSAAKEVDPSKTEFFSHDIAIVRNLFEKPNEHISDALQDLSVAENLINQPASEQSTKDVVTHPKEEDVIEVAIVAETALENETQPPLSDNAEKPSSTSTEGHKGPELPQMHPTPSAEKPSSSSAAGHKGSELQQMRPNPSPKTSKLTPLNFAETNMDFDPVTLLTMKQERFDYFNDSVSIGKAFASLSLEIRDLPQDQRQLHLTKGLENINEMLLRRMNGDPGSPQLPDSPAPTAEDVINLGVRAALRSVHLPLTRASSRASRILQIHPEEAKILTSRTRAPYLVNIEILPTQMLCSHKFIFCEGRLASQSRKEPCEPKESTSLVEQKSDPPVSVKKVSRPSSVRRLSKMTPAERQRANVRTIIYGSAYSAQPDDFAAVEEPRDEIENKDDAEAKARQAVVLGVYGELWSWKEERILRKSPFRDWKGTKLMPFIVKAGDDLRQEQLAIQLINQFYKIFKEEKVNLYLKPFTVMSMSSEAGFIEVLTDSVSVHSLKKRTPNFVSILDYFTKAYGPIESQSFRSAQRRFIRSMAGYSLVTYILQIKDRHNGNIMIDALGRIVHIDFGFMLTNSPGAIKFEDVPFKLTEEYLQVICAKENVQDLAGASKTEGYRYFQELFVLGLLAARKHQDKITTLVEIMTEGTTMPCMTGGHSIVEALRSRFAVGMPEELCIKYGLKLIEESRLSWRSAGYDRFQAYSNGYR